MLGKHALIQRLERRSLLGNVLINTYGERGKKKGWERKKLSYDTDPTKTSAYPTGALEQR